MTTTTSIRNELKRRLLALGETSSTKISTVLNPDEARSPANAPAANTRMAVLWTMDAALENQRADRFQLRQMFAVDVPVPWTPSIEPELDKIRIELASVMIAPFNSLAVQKQEVTSIEIGYPSEGSQYAVVSITAEYTYIEKLN